MKIALFPGSFDPITKGHQNIIERASNLFDKIIIGIGNNSTKKYLFSLEERKRFISETFKSNPKIEVIQYNGLTVDFCREINAKYILRGIRNTADYNYEAPIAQMNSALENSIETVFFLTSPEFAAINSTIVRDIIINGGNVSQFVPNELKGNFEK